MHYYKCESCKKIFDEFEMNYKMAQEDKKILCATCRNIKGELKKMKNANDYFNYKKATNCIG